MNKRFRSRHLADDQYVRSLLTFYLIDSCYAILTLAKTIAALEKKKQDGGSTGGLLFRFQSLILQRNSNY